MSISSIKKALKNVFQGKLKNLVSLADDSPIDNHLKCLKIGDGHTPLELSQDEVCYKGKEIVAGDIEGTGIKSTGETGGTKFLREDGDGTCSWQTAGGGTNQLMFANTMRGRAQYNNWFTSNYYYGAGYYYWTQSAGANLPSTHQDGRLGSYVVPVNGTIKSYIITGYLQSADTYEWALMRGTGHNFGNTGDYNLTQIGSTQSAGGGSYRPYKWEETGLSASVLAGDIINLYFRRSTDNDSSYSYHAAHYCIIMEPS